MKKNVLTLSISGLILLFTISSIDAAKNGFGLFGGLARHTSEVTTYSTEYTSSGLSIGVDYQFALSDSFSISAFYIFSDESTSGDIISDATASHDILGVQGRFWIDEMFVGAHFGIYSEFLESELAGSADGSGSGFGIIVGWEGDNGMFFSAQYDSASGLGVFTDSDIDLTGFRLHGGYRWK